MLDTLILAKSVIESHVKAIVEMTRSALENTRLAGSSYFWYRSELRVREPKVRNKGAKL